MGLFFSLQFCGAGFRWRFSTTPTDKTSFLTTTTTTHTYTRELLGVECVDSQKSHHAWGLTTSSPFSPCNSLREGCKKNWPPLPGHSYLCGRLCVCVCVCALVENAAAASLNFCSASNSGRRYSCFDSTPRHREKVNKQARGQAFGMYGTHTHSHGGGGLLFNSKVHLLEPAVCVSGQELHY